VSKREVAVLGSGSQGVIMAGILALQGHKVSLVDLPSFYSSLEPIKQAGYIDVAGGYDKGEGRPDLITTGIEEGIEDREILLVCVPAYGHEAITLACLPHLEDDQILVYISYFGALRMRRLLDKKQIQAHVTVSEILSCLYAGRKVGQNGAFISKKKDGLPFAACPASETTTTLARLSGVLPDLQLARNCLETSITNINPFAHVAGTLLNAGWIEATRGAFGFYGEGKTSGVRRLEKALDQEKVGVAGALSLSKISTSDLSGKLYRNVPRKPSHSKPTRVHDAPDNLGHRYLTEDIPYGLVPLAAIGHQLDVPVPITDATIQLGSIATGLDFVEHGITLNELGLEGQTREEMLALVA